MIFHLRLNNPFSSYKFDNLFSTSGVLTYNKCWEFEVLKNNVLFEFDLTLEFIGRDHAGPGIAIGLFGYGVHFKIYDHRHWDYERDTWE